MTLRLKEWEVLTSKPDSGAKKPNAEAVEVIFDLLKGAPENQLILATHLDTRMVQVFQVASVVIGLVGISSGALAGWWLVEVLLICALIAYFATVAIAFYHWHPVNFNVVALDSVWEAERHKEPAEVRTMVATLASKAYRLNQAALRQKTDNLRNAIVTTGVEVLLVGIALVLSLVT